MNETHITIRRCSWCGRIISCFGLTGKIDTDVGIRMICDKCFDKLEVV